MSSPWRFIPPQTTRYHRPRPGQPEIFHSDRCCHAQTNTPLIFVAIACIFHEAPLLLFFFYHLSPKVDVARALSILVYLVCD